MRAGALAYPPELRAVEDGYAPLFVRTPALKAATTRPRLTRVVGRVVDAVLGGMAAEVVLRCRYSDDAIRAAHTSGTTQVVMLGSGYDSTSVRLSEPGLRFFEVDHPDTQLVKRDVLAVHAPAAALERVVFVPCDFDRDDFAACLRGAGFDATRPAIVNWMAVSWYLSADAVVRTLRALAAATAPGSRLVFNYMKRAAVDGRGGGGGATRARTLAAGLGEPWRFGIDPRRLGPWLAELGFELDEHVSGDELAGRYLPSGAPVQPAPFIGIATAVRCGSPAGGAA